MATFRENIFSLFVKFDSTSHTLSERSLDNILLRVAYRIYAEKGEKPFSNKELKNRLDPLMGGDVDIRRIDDSIKNQNFRFTPCGNNRYTLSGKAYKELKEAEAISISAHRHIINKYFNGSTTPEELLVEWLKWVLSEFFVLHFVEYTQKLHFDKKSEEYQKDIETIITRSFEIKDIRINNEQAFLRTHFRYFFEDRNDQENNALFWNYGVTCFAARMADSTMFADQFTVQALKDTTFVLDTNVLFTINLEDSFDQETIVRLENTLKDLNTTLLYLLPTKDEYRRVANGSYAYLIGRADNLREIEFSTQINDAAVRYGCFDKESIDQFFEAHINSLPTLMRNSLPINIEDSKELIEFLKNKENHKEVNQKYRALLKERQSTKKENPIVHDIHLLSYVYYLRRQQKKYTILTNDSSLQEYATRNPVWDEGAIAISLDTLIAILSINFAGVGDNGFENLFKELVKLNFKPLEDDDIKQPDLYIINDILTKIGEINPEKGEELQREVLKLRSTNAPFNQIHLLLVRELKLQDYSQRKELDKYKSINADQKRQIESQTPLVNYLHDDIFNKIAAKRKMRRTILVIIKWVLIIGGLAWLFMTCWPLITGSRLTIKDYIQIAISIMVTMGGVSFNITKISDSYEALSLRKVDIEEATQIEMKKISKYN